MEVITLFRLCPSVDYPTKQPPATVLEPGHIVAHQASRGGEAKGLSLVGLEKGGCRKAHVPCMFNEE